MQDQSSKTSEINELREYIRKIEPQLNEYQEQIQQLVNELNQTKQNAEVSSQELMAHADTEHNRNLGEKNTELEGLKEKYSEMEETFNRYKKNYPNQVHREVIRMLGAATAKKDQEIQRLQEQINQLLNQQGMQKTEMEEEGLENFPLKIEPERIEIEEKKEEIIPRQGMQTRSQGPPSYGEKFHQEEYDPLGNLTWKGNIYSIPVEGDYKAYDVVVNLLHKASGKNKTFKMNFANYVREKENYYYYYYYYLSRAEPSHTAYKRL